MSRHNAIIDLGGSEDCITEKNKAEQSADSAIPTERSAYGGMQLRNFFN